MTDDSRTSSMELLKKQEKLKLQRIQDTMDVK